MPPFELLHSCPLFLLSLKVCFLVSITTPRMIGELAALRGDPSFIQFFPNKVVLHPSFEILPKIVSTFPCLYLFLILLPQWKKHCMIWMLREVYYIIFTKQNCFGGLFVCLLFVSSVCPPVGCATSLQTISRWIVWAITNMLMLFALYPFERIPLGYNHHLQHSKEVSFCWRTVRPQLSPQRTCSSAQFCVGSLVLSPMWDYTENRKWKQHCSYL